MLDLNPETNTGNTDIAGLFAKDLTGVDISRPVIRGGTYLFNVESCEVAAQKAPKVGQNLVIKLSLATMATSDKNETINPGFTLMTQIALTPTGKLTADMIDQHLKRFQVACGRSGAFGSPASYKGCRCLVRLAVKMADDYGPDRNEVKDFSAPKPV